MPNYILICHKIKLTKMSSTPTELNPQVIQHHKSYQSHRSQIVKSKITNYLAKNINHSNDPEKFYKQIDEQFQNHLQKMQAQIERQVKRKNIIKQMQHQRQKYRQQWQAKIQNKLQMSEKKRDKDTKQKVEKHAKFRQYREDVAQQRVKQIKKQQLIKSLKKRKEYYDEQKQNQTKQHLITRNASESRFNHSSVGSIVAKQKKILLHSQILQHIMNEASKKKIFEVPKKHQRHISLDPVQPRKSLRQLQDAIYVEKTVVDLEKIKQARKRKQKQIQSLILKKQKIQNFSSEMHQGRIADLNSKQKAWKRAVIQKDRSKSELVRRMKQEKQQKIGQLRRSFIQDSTNNLDKQVSPAKISYRKQIKKKMDDYLKEEKANIIKRMMSKQSK